MCKENKNRLEKSRSFDNICIKGKKNLRKVILLHKKNIPFTALKHLYQKERKKKKKLIANDLFLMTTKPNEC